MDIAVLAVLILTIFFSMRKGFALSVAGFFKGFLSLFIAWFFCDNLAELLMKKTEIGVKISERIGQGLSSKWESSDFYMALPDLFKSNSEIAPGDSLITDGSMVIAELLLKILCFAAIVFILRAVLALVSHSFSHRFKGGFTGAVDWILGLLLGIVLGILYVFLFLALIVPVVGIFIPEQWETVVGWLDSSLFAGDLYDNNLLLVLFRDFL